MKQKKGNRLYLLLLLALNANHFTFGQEIVTLSGYITDLESNETAELIDSNFPSKGQFFISIFNKITKLEKVGVTPFKTKKAYWF